VFPKNVPEELCATKKTGPVTVLIKPGSAKMESDVFPPVVPKDMFATNRNCVFVAGDIARLRAKIIVCAKIVGRLICGARISVAKNVPEANTDPRAAASVFGNPVLKAKEEARTGSVTAGQGAVSGRNYPAMELIVLKNSVLRELKGMLLPSAVCLLIKAAKNVKVLITLAEEEPVYLMNVPGAG
jgi:hypothetical protein